MDNIITCPACHAKNKVPVEKSGEKAKCGKCGAVLPEAPPLILRCIECGSKNRVPIAKLNSGATCGKCHAPIHTEDVLAAWTIPVSDINFETKVLQSPLPVLLECVSASCGACTVSRPVINQLAAEWKGRIRVCRTDVIQNPITANKYEVMSTPTSLILDRGRLVDKIIGAAPREMYIQKMTPFLS
jgi:thioredoxin 2